MVGRERAPGSADFSSIFEDIWDKPAGRSGARSRERAGRGMNLVVFTRISGISHGVAREHDRVFSAQKIYLMGS